MSASDLVGVGLLALGGFLVGGVVTTWPRHRLVAVVLAVLAALAVVGAVLRLLPA